MIRTIIQCKCCKKFRYDKDIWVRKIPSNIIIHDGLKYFSTTCPHCSVVIRLELVRVTEKLTSIRDIFNETYQR
jgi:hypothetical protein